jgi:hypothetical protein
MAVLLISAVLVAGLTGGIKLLNFFFMDSAFCILLGISSVPSRPCEIFFFAR